MRHLFLLILVSWVALSQTIAQNTLIFDSRVEKQIQFTPPYKYFAPEAIESAKKLNALASRARPTVNVGVSWKQIAQLIRVSANAYRIMLYAEDVKAMPKLVYKEFDLSQSFRPLNVSIKIEINNTKRKFRKSFDYPDQSFAAMLANGLTFSIEDTVELTESKLLITYSNANLSARQAEELSATMAAADTLASYKGSIAQQWVRLITPFMAQNIDSIKAAITYISQANALLTSPAPASLQPLSTYSQVESKALANDLDALRDALAKRTLVVQAAQKDLDKLLVQKAENFYRFGKRAEAQALYEEALIFNQVNEVALHRAAQYEVEKGYYEKALRRFAAHADVLKAIRYQRLLDRAARGVETAIIKSNRLGNSQESTRYLSLLDSICRRYPGYRCPDFSQAQASTTDRAEYQKLVNSARAAVSRNEMAEAEILAQQAVEYSEHNAMAISAIQSAKMFLAQVRKRYAEQLAYRARDQFKKGLDSLAIHNLYLASGKNDRLGLGLNNLIAPVSQSFALPYLKKQMEYGYKASITDKPLGDSITARATVYADALKLYNAPAFQQSLQTLAKATNTPECKKAALQYADYYAKADQLVLVSKHVEASIQIQKAINVSNQNPTCFLNSSSAVTLLTSIAKPLLYNSLQTKADAFARKENFDSAYNYHTIAQEMHVSGQLSKFNIAPVSDYQFFTTSSEPNMAIFGMEHYLKTGKTDSALIMSQKVPSRGFSKNYWAYVSEKVGEALARRDHRIQPRPDAEAMIKSYTGADRRYKDFTKGYQKAWNELGS